MEGLRYNIKDLENFTQIKAHTIRIWEQRYNLLKPKRTKTNIRYYDQDDLKKILNINLLYNSGLKISKIAELTENEIIEIAKSNILITDEGKQSEIDALVLLILSFKGIEIKEKLKNYLATNSIEVMYENIILPLLDKIGQLWQVNTFCIIHEHYFSSIFREIVFSEINGIEKVGNNSKSVLLFLHDNEEHEFGLLIAYFIFKKYGYTCHNFGQKTPINEILLAFKQIQPNIVFTTFTNRINEKHFQQIEMKLIEMSKKSTVIIAGNQLLYLKSPVTENIVKMNSINDLNSILKSLINQ